MAFDPSKYKNVSSGSSSKSCHDCDADEQLEDLTFTPRVLYFHYVTVGDTSQAQPFLIENTGELPVGIADITVTGDFELAGNFPASLNPGESINLLITFKPTVDGALTGDVIVDAGTSGPQECVHLVGIGGEDVFAEDVSDLQNQIDTLEAQIAAITAALEGYTLGTPVYTWRAYANSANGHLNFTTGAPNGHSYIGLAFNKDTNIPSEDPDDYEWSELGMVVSNIFAYDTTNVAGRPASQVLSDLDALSLSLLAYQFDRQQLRDYVDALLYVDGVPVNAAVLDLENVVTTETSALAETLGIIGAKTPDGESFILDLNKTYVDENLSLGQKLTNMVAATEFAQASYQTLQQTIAEADYASVSDLSLLGAKTLDGTAWVLDLATVLVSPTETLSQYINQQIVEANGSEASVTQLYEALVTPDGGASAKALLQLDVNGHVVGYSATNDGSTGEINFTFDSFNILHPGSLDPVFSVVGGVVKMTNVEIDTLKVGSVLTENLASGAIRKSYSSELASNKNLPLAGTINVTSLSTIKDVPESDMEITWMMRMRPGIAYAGYFTLYEKVGAGAYVAIDSLWYWLDNVSLGGLQSVRMTVPYIRRFPGRPVGQIDYRLDFTYYAKESNYQGHIEAGSGFFVEEIKR